MRTRQTLAPLVHRLTTPAPPIALEKGLYLASEGDLLVRLRAVTEEVRTVLLIGHNEGIGELAEALAGDGEPAALASLHEKYPDRRAGDPAAAARGPGRTSRRARPSSWPSSGRATWR